MSFFREYLKENKVIPDPRFDEGDEASLVRFLLEARMHHTAAGLEIKTGFFARRELNRELATVEAKNEMIFVAAFLCFFVTKPLGYLREMEAFKEHFIPGFSMDTAKQAQLARGLRKNFFTGAVESLVTAETLDLYFDIAELGASAGTTIWTGGK
jgi:hypothetical protein